MNDSNQDELEQLVAAVRAGSRYRYVGLDFVRRIAEEERTKRSSFKEAVKATRAKLHQVGGAYFDETMSYDSWVSELQTTARLSDAKFRNACTRIMWHHASSKERLPILKTFYTTLFADRAPIKRVLDVACGLHPLSIPWMPLAQGASYYAYDIYEDMIGFVQTFLDMMHVQGHAKVCDIVGTCPQDEADVAFVLKVLPCLEQIDKQAGLRLLESLNAPCIVVSFPVRSLSGRHKGMVAHYEQQFQEVVAGKPWPTQRFAFASELVFVIDKE